MPSVHRVKGFKFYVYPNDHDPAHIHAQKGNGEVRIQICGVDGEPEFMSVYGMSDKDAIFALEVVAEKREQFLMEWCKYHGCEAAESVQVKRTAK